MPRVTSGSPRNAAPTWTPACRLAVAIDRHRQVGVQEGIDPEPHDQALWEVLGEVRVPQGSELVAAAELLADGVWP